MDPITHGLLGACASHSTTHKHLGKAAIGIGAAAGTIPDLDVFIRSSSNPMLSIEYHRHFTHALAFVPLGGLIVTLLFVLFFKSLRAKWPYVLLAATVAYLTHGLLDSATSYGTLLWWPFSNQRVAWDVISIVDPVFTLFLILGVIFAYRKQLRYPAVIALSACLGYLTFGFVQHHRALTAQVELAATRHQQIEKNRVMPGFATLYHYRSIYINNRTIYVDSIATPLFKSSTVMNGISIPLFTEQNLPVEIKNNVSLQHDYAIFNWFSDGYVAAISQQPLILADMRYLRSLQPLQPAWVIEFPHDITREHVYWRTQMP